MPIHKVEGGYQWGGRGKVYPTREGAARQARAAYANGYVGKSLSEMGRETRIRKASTREDKQDRAGAAATGAGVVGVGAGLAGGGIPGLKATRISSDFMGKKPMPVKTRLANFVRARRAGAFGYRVNAHSTLKNFNLSDEGIKYHNPQPGKVGDLIRAAEHGKVAPEEKIIRHLKTGRKASHALLAGGAGLTAAGVAQKQHAKRREAALAKADNKERRDTALVAGGGAGAAGSYGASRLLESQGRKWTRQASQNFSEAQKIVPELGPHTVKRGKHKILGRSNVPSVRSGARLKPTKAKEGTWYRKPRAAKAANITEEMVAHHPKAVIERAGKLHGTATNQSYFGHVYGTMGSAMRKVAAPVGLAAAGAGGLSIANRRRKENLGKAYTPSYFQGSVPTERLQAQRQRTRTEAQRAALQGTGVGLAGASGAALGARLLGHDAAPAAVRAAGAYGRKQGVPKETVKDLTHRADKVHTWARNKRGRLLAGAAAAAGGATAARAAARWKREEVTGISQDLGRATAGDRLQMGSRRVTKGLGTAVIGSYGMRGAKKWASLDPKTRNRIVTGTLVGTTAGGTAAGTAWTVNRGDRWHSEKKRLKEAGGAAGPVMKSEDAVIGKARALIGGSNVREYSYLPENIRQQVGYGSIGIRRNPMSPLDLFAASRTMTAMRGDRISRRRMTAQAKREMNYAGARAMLYSPTGRGSVF